MSEPERRLSGYVAAFCMAWLLSSSAYASMVWGVAEETWSNHAEEQPAREIFEFYREDAERARADPSVTRVYWLGSSMMRDAVDANVVDADLERLGIRDVVNYNLAISADVPLRRLVELPALLNASPEWVVWGVEARTFHTLLAGEYLNRFEALRGVAPPVSPESEAGKILGQPYVDALRPFEPEAFDPGALLVEFKERRGLVHTQIHQALDPGPSEPEEIEDEDLWREKNVWRPRAEVRGNYKDPWVIDAPKATTEELQRFAQRFPKIERQWTIEDLDNSNIRAFEHILETLTASGTRVLLIEMPTNPAFTPIPVPGTPEKMDLLLDRFDAMPGVDVIHRDATGMPPEAFRDFDHLHADGRQAFSHRSAELLVPFLEGRG